MFCSFVVIENVDGDKSTPGFLIQVKEKSEAEPIFQLILLLAQMQHVYIYIYAVGTVESLAPPRKLTLVTFSIRLRASILIWAIKSPVSCHQPIVLENRQ